MKIYLRALTLVALLLGVGVLSPSNASADCHCFCRMGAIWYGGALLLKDFGSVATYDSLQCIHPENLTSQCQTVCKGNAEAQATQLLTNKNALCQQVAWAGVVNLMPASWVATTPISPFGYVGAVTCSGGVSTCTCPASWLSNTSSQPGGVTTDSVHPCKRPAGSISGSPLPANGTPLETWGFSWGSVIYQYGPATCTTTPWVGK